MALAAKLLVGALFLGAGSTVTYVACTGGFGAGENGTESEASGEAQVAASPAPSSSGTPVESAPRQDQPDAPAESAVDSSHSADAEGTGVGANDQVPGTDGRVEQAQSIVTAEDSGAEQSPRAAGEESTSGLRNPVQELDSDRVQDPEVSSSQTLNDISGGENNDGLEGKTTVDNNAEDTVVSSLVAGVAQGKDEAVESGQRSKGQTDNDQPQPAGQSDVGGGTSEQGVTPPEGTGNVQGVTSPSVTDQESTNPGATLQSD